MFYASYIFESLPITEIQQLKNEAISKYGRLNVQRAEGFLQKLTKEFLLKLKLNHDSIITELFKISSDNPDSIRVQQLIELHYNSVKQFWGTVISQSIHLEAYLDLADKYANDLRFSFVNGELEPEFGIFMSKAMKAYCKRMR